MPVWDAARLRLVVTDAELGTVTPADPSLPEPATEMLQTIAAPSLRVLVQLYTSADPPVNHRIWATPRAAVLAVATGDGRAELSAAEPVLIPYLVAHLVGLRRNRPPQGRTLIQVPLAVYRAAEAGSAEVPQLAAVIRSRRSSWRVTAASPDTTVKSLHVTDSGPAGLWQVTKSTPDPATLTFTPLRPRDAWSILIKEILS
ncbi:hypothetical protein Rhe02_41320 [Rhizocola hellebori]|uniref:Uncharacterized protein n=1 Tax=Rhizocola hellebori TaxID=1392758 RepID=A0A8J3QAK3_9ACTN|nr:hypothetical protein [Rhizocola hellebori]GIH06065.1 hypothetical protein Rhe02_41320 [Rhizocola hellebori]